MARKKGRRRRGKEMNVNRLYVVRYRRDYKLIIRRQIESFFYPSLILLYRNGIALCYF